jgi:hypothetical protein
MSRCGPIEKSSSPQVLNLRILSWTDFYSVVETTQLRPVKMNRRGNHPWMNLWGRRVPIKILVHCRFRTCIGTVQEIDLDSVVATILARTKLRWDPRKPSMCESSRRRNRCWICCGNQTTKTSSISLWGHHPWVNVKVCSRKNLVEARFRTCLIQEKQINRFWFCCGNHMGKTLLEQLDKPLTLSMSQCQGVFR